MSSSLRHAGYDVGMATDSRGGLASIMANPPHCLILDVILPGMNGYAVCRQIRGADPAHTIPIIMVSTKNTLLDQNYALKLGADRYLAKPFSQEALIQTVREVLPASFLPVTDEVFPQSITDKVLRQPEGGQRETLENQASLEVYTLIPYREREADILTVSSPFARAPLIGDKQLRHLYATIDGYKTVRDLSHAMHLDVQTMLQLLKTLWQQGRIAFYDAERHPLKEIPLSLSSL